MGKSDVEPEKMEIYRTGWEVKIDQGVRHRLVGLKGWGLVAEIWTHTDSINPSDEEDIKRVADVYGREM